MFKDVNNINNACLYDFYQQLVSIQWARSRCRCAMPVKLLLCVCVYSRCVYSVQLDNYHL
jgi:hypothetical protein